ncbi:MAG TPA: FAD-dependent oxidoreductase [Nannocystaceae bacterium]|nr:FAD-dependent oxidoreductase [Nannocystaceae bacterium]
MRSQYRLFIGLVTENGRVVILGAGLTGLSTALHLPGALVVAERDESVGGKARSHRRDGFTFDVTGHWLHLSRPRSRAFVSELFAEGDLVEIERRTGVYSHGAMLTYPFQANLHGLPLPIVHECLVGLFEAHRRAEPDTPGSSLQEFAERRFGAGIARHFFVPYNTKLWGVAPDRMSSSWVTRYIPVPEPSQIIAGAIGMRQEGLGYNARFLYPKGGGIDALPEAMRTKLAARRDVELLLGTALDELDARARTVVVGGRRFDWQRLISTIPLPALIERIVDAPAEIRDAASSLRSVRWRWLDIAMKTPAPIPEHWIYVPEPHLPFFRVGIYSNASPAMAPPGCSNLYVELTDREHAPDVPAILAALAQMRAITAPADVAFVEPHDVEHAYVVFDDAHASATAAIQAWLAQHDIRSCGRYGAWVYSSMEDALLDGMEAAAWAQR